MQKKISNDGTIRLNRVLSNAGVCSRRDADVYIQAGVVTVNVELKDSLFYNMLTQITGVEIKNEGELFSCISSFAKIKKDS